MPPARLEDLLRTATGGEPSPVYLVAGDLVVAEPRARELAKALAEKAACEVVEHRRPAGLGDVIADLRTFSLFAAAKVVLVVDAAIFADRRSAAELIDQAAAALPFDEAAGLDRRRREAASRLLQTFHVFSIDAFSSEPAETVAALPKWALQGGGALRKRKPRGRPAKAVKELAAGLAALLGAARDAGLQGFAEGDLAELGEIVHNGLPDGHSLVLAESAVATDHPVVSALGDRGAFLEVASVGVDRGGEWKGLGSLVAELESQTGAGIARDALDELARRTLRKSGGGWGDSKAQAESTARFAGEYRKLANLTGGQGRISRTQVEEAVEDRGDEDVWKILDAVGAGHGDQALERYRRLLASADDAMGARLSFFGLLAGFCRQLTAVAGVARAVGVGAGERNYNRFKSSLAPRLTGDLPIAAKNPLAGVHPFRLHRAYLAASRLDRGLLAHLPWLVLETELRVKGESTQADAAIGQLMARLASGT